MLIHMVKHQDLDYRWYKVVQVFPIDQYLRVKELDYFLQHLNVLNLIKIFEQKK